MTPPSLPFHVWIAGAFDPILIVVAVWLGWKATQFGKVFIAAIAALAVSVILSWVISSIGLPWVAPITHDTPTLYPVRVIGAFLWASGAYFVRRIRER